MIFSKFPFQKQHDATQCGVSCISMICKYYGERYSLNFLEKLCPINRDGTSLKALSSLCNELGLNNIAIRVSIDALSECDLPCVLHWNQNHFVVLYKISNNKYSIADPAQGLLRLSRYELEKCWITDIDGTNPRGIAFLIEPNENFGKVKENGSEHFSPLKFILSYISRFHKFIIQILLGIVFGCLLQLLMPFLTQWIVDLGIKNEDISLIWLILLGELIIIFARTVTDFIRRWLLLHISMRINISLLSDFFIKLVKLPMSFYDTRLLGDLLQRMSDHERVQSFLTTQILGIAFSIISFFVFGVVLLVYDKLIFTVFLSGTMLLAIWMSAFLNIRRNVDYELFNANVCIQNQIYQFISSIQEIKLQNCGKRRRWEWEDSQAELFNIQMKTLRLQQVQEAGSIFISELRDILITVLAATAVINGQITLGTMLAIQYIVGQINSPVERIMQFVYSLQDVKISIDRIGEIHKFKDENCNEESITSFTGEKDIKISKLNFKYDRHAPKLTISDVNAYIPDGKVTAVVGASGSGKTTLLKLILGYYTPLSGTICVSDNDVEIYNLDWLRSRCGVVMQDGVIFSETIERNIAVGDDIVDYDKIVTAAKIACIHDFVETLPLQYATKVGKDGIGLSQGQKQRLLIARAVYKDPDFIFLDEATNALDAKNERDIVTNLNSFYKGRTVLVVAHRLSTVRSADQILVLDEGKLVESGSHEQLTAKKGIYYNLVKNQLELNG